MNVTAVALALAMSASMVPPDEEVEDHSQPYHYTQPTLRSFEWHADDLDRRRDWEIHVRELEYLWREYRMAGSTPRAWEVYKQRAAEAKRRYVFGDDYLAPIEDPLYFEP